LNRTTEQFIQTQTKMVLTAAQTMAFFKQATQMVIPNVTVIALENEGIDTIEDLIDVDKTTLTQVADNLRRPGGGGAPLVFGAKSQQRLLAATNLVKYYDTVGRPLTAANLQWDRTMRNFKEQYKALQDKKEADPRRHYRSSSGQNRCSTTCIRS
jgi:hypothetical protein